VKTCYFCDNKWGACTCRFDEHPDAGFLWRGTAIKDPCTDDSGRWFVDPVAYYGEPYIKWRDSRVALLSEVLGRVRRRRIGGIVVIPNAAFSWEATGNIERSS
jgi:hypothetical protein